MNNPIPNNRQVARRLKALRFDVGVMVSAGGAAVLLNQLVHSLG